MSEPPKDQNPAKSGDSAKLDSTTAAAALALAVASAEKSGARSAKPEVAKPEQAKTAGDTQKNWPALPARWRAHATRAAAMALAIGLGWAGGSQAWSGGKQALPVIPDWVEAATAGIRQNQENIVRLTGDVRVLKDIVQVLKESFDEAKLDLAGQQRALVERAEGIERAAKETAATIAHVLEASDRIERVSADAGAKLAALSGRLDDVEKQAKTAATAVKSASAADGPAHTGSVPAPKEVPLQGWVLRDVYAGVALVESRSGRLHEVVPGTKLPNAGRVEAIERRGRMWIVVTSKGIIGAQGRWH